MNLNLETGYEWKSKLTIFLINTIKQREITTRNELSIFLIKLSKKGKQQQVIFIIQNAYYKYHCVKVTSLMVNKYKTKIFKSNKIDFPEFYKLIQL